MCSESKALAEVCLEGGPGGLSIESRKIILEPKGLTLFVLLVFGFALDLSLISSFLFLSLEVET